MYVYFQDKSFSKTTGDTRIDYRLVLNVIKVKISTSPNNIFDTAMVPEWSPVYNSWQKNDKEMVKCYICEQIMIGISKRKYYIIYFTHNSLI